MPNQSTPNRPAPPCPKCGGLRTTFWNKTGARAGQHQYRCAPCKSKADAASHQKHRGQRNQRNREYYASTRERWQEYWRQRYAENPEPVRARALRHYYEHREEAIKRAKRWEARNPERAHMGDQARYAVAKAIRHGVLARPAICEQCGISGKAIEGAHHDYSRPLDVRWLCKSCHSVWDHADPKTLVRE